MIPLERSTPGGGGDGVGGTMLPGMESRQRVLCHQMELLKHKTYSGLHCVWPAAETVSMAQPSGHCRHHSDLLLQQCQPGHLHISLPSSHRT